MKFILVMMVVAFNSSNDMPLSTETSFHKFTNLSGCEYTAKSIQNFYESYEQKGYAIKVKWECQDYESGKVPFFKKIS